MDLGLQFHEAKVMVAGLQETRSLRSTRCRGDQYLMVGSAAKGDAGGVPSGGCELWLHLDLGLRDEDLYVIEDHPERLIVRANLHRRSLLVCVGHAPTSDREQTVIRKWWADTTAALSAAVRPHDFIVALLDANAKVGSLRSCSVGGFAADEETFGGQELHQFLLRFDLVLPATIEGVARESSAGDWTWTNHRGGRHRIDYVAIPASWLEATHWAAVLDKIDLTVGAALDHRAVGVHIASPAASYSKAPAPWYDRNAFRNPDTAEAARALWAKTPRFPSAMPCNDMAELFEKWCRLIMREVAPAVKAMPRAPWIAPATWDCMELRRKTMRWHQWHLARATDLQPWHAASAAALRTEVLALVAKLKKLIRADKSAWLIEQAEEVQAGLDVGSSSKLWDLVRSAGGRKKRAPRAAAVLRDASGCIIQDQAAASRAWQQRFLAEFGGNGTLVDEHLVAARPTLCLPPEIGPSPLTEEEWSSQLTDVYGALRVNVATGTGLVIGAVLKAGGPHAAALHGQVAAACSTHGVPDIWKGGEMAGVPRKAAAPLTLGNSRGVLCSSIPGKCVAKIARRHAVPALVRLAGGMQMGAIPGGGTVYPAAAVQCFLREARLRKVPRAALFADLTAAFYSIPVEAALGTIMSAAGRREAFAATGMNEEDVKQFEAAYLQHGGKMLEAGLDQPWVALLRDWATDTWFTVRGSGDRTYARLGTRPGDPLADLVFAVSFLAFQLTLNDNLLRVGISATVKVRGPGIFADGALEVEVPLLPPTYLDDFVLLLEAADCMALLDRAAQAADIAVRTATAFGLRLNFLAGKTELVAVLCGKRKREAGARLALLRDADGVQVLPLSDGGQLRVVRAYRHLGAIAACGAALSQDIAHRAAAAHVATTALQRSVFARPGISAAAKTAVAKACVHGRSNYLMGLWGFIPAGAMGRLQAAMMRPYRIILGLNRAPEDGCHVSAVEVLRRLRQPSPAWTVVLARIATGIKLSTAAPAYIRGLLQGRGGDDWRFALSLSLAALQRLVAPKLDDMPHPALEPAAWEAAWRSAPAAWHSVVKAATLRAGADPVRAAAVLARFPELDSRNGDFTDTEGDEFMCGHPGCAMFFTSVSGVTTHRLKAHPELPSLPRLVRQSVLGTTCPACGTEFHQRLRVLHHLRRRGGEDSTCRARVLAGEFLGHPEELLAAADAADAEHRRCCRRAGRHVLAGPVCFELLSDAAGG